MHLLSATSSSGVLERSFANREATGPSSSWATAAARTSGRGASCPGAVPEWQATLDALQTLPEIGPGGPVGYWGVALGTAIGVPLTASRAGP